MDSVARLVFDDWPFNALVSERMVDGTWRHHGQPATAFQLLPKDRSDGVELLPSFAFDQGISTFNRRARHGH